MKNIGSATLVGLEVGVASYLIAVLSQFSHSELWVKVIDWSGGCNVTPGVKASRQ